MRRPLLILGLLIAFLIATPARGASGPTLHLFSVNAAGSADLLPGQTVLVVVELRSEALTSATVGVGTPDGFFLERADATAGALAIPDMQPATLSAPVVRWSGEVSSTLPINIRLIYRVQSNARPGDRQVTASGQAAGTPFAGSTLIRVCCLAAPPARSSGTRLYLPAFRH